MTETPIDLATWERAGQFHLFKGYDRPHYAITSRLDVSHVMRQKQRGVSAYRACIYAIGAGIHAVPALCMRFRGERVVQHDQIALSMPVPNENGSFNYAYVPYIADFSDFDGHCAEIIVQAARRNGLGANTGVVDDVAYLSCLPWLDYTSINNAMPGPDDCIPRVSWGKIVEEGTGHRMAMTLEVHHALVDGQQVGAYFEAVQSALNAI